MWCSLCCTERHQSVFSNNSGQWSKSQRKPLIQYNNYDYRQTNNMTTTRSRLLISNLGTYNWIRSHWTKDRNSFYNRTSTHGVSIFETTSSENVEYMTRTVNCKIPTLLTITRLRKLKSCEES